MTAIKKTRIPSLRCNNNRGFVELNGRRIYLGAWGEPETQNAYERTISEWLSNRKLPYVNKDVITIAELCRDYWLHCEEYYVQPDGTATSSLLRTKQALRPLLERYNQTLASDFGALSLRAIQTAWIDSGLKRKSINDYTAVIKQLFKWAVSHEKININVYKAINTVDNLKAGRSSAIESTPIQQVPQSHIDAVEPYVSYQVWALVQLQLLTGTRAGELLKLRPIDLDTTGEIWTVNLAGHKTAHLGKKRTIYFGSKAQSILKEFMNTTPIHSFLFSPKDATKERYAKADTHRRTSQKKTPTSSGRVVGKFYTTESYRRAITRACEKAGVPSWTPHRLRHNAGTFIRKEYGLEAAQVILGHSRADITQLYAEADTDKAMRVIREIG